MSSRTAVGEALASPTPTLERTAREASKPAMLLEKACRESCHVSLCRSPVIRGLTYMYLISDEISDRDM